MDCNIAEAPNICSDDAFSQKADISKKGAPPPESRPIRRRGPNRDAPRVDPPEKGVAIPENAPARAAVAFRRVFQTWAADFQATRRKQVGFMGRARRILINGDGRAIRDKMIRYWAFNTNGRRLDSRKRKVCLDRAPGSSDINLPDIAKEDKKSIVRKMIAFTSDIPGALGDAAQARQRLELAADQIERRTSRMGDNEGVGRIHVIFFDFAAPVYKWGRLNRLIRRLRGRLGPVEGANPEAEKAYFPQKKKGRL